MHIKHSLVSSDGYKLIVSHSCGDVSKESVMKSIAFLTHSAGPDDCKPWPLASMGREPRFWAGNALGMATNGSFRPRTLTWSAIPRKLCSSCAVLLACSEMAAMLLQSFSSATPAITSSAARSRWSSGVTFTDSEVGGAGAVRVSRRKQYLSSSSVISCFGGLFGRISDGEIRDALPSVVSSSLRSTIRSYVTWHFWLIFVS
jgi:hypothetical protein